MSQLEIIFSGSISLPGGVRDQDLEKIYDHSWRAYLSLLNTFEEIPLALHVSGIGLEWLESSHPEYLMLLKKLVNRKQIELVGGAYYEPALPIIPNSDRIGQIEKLTTFLRSHYGMRPRGVSLAKDIWEPFLVSTLASCGMEYVFLDKSLFLQSGINIRDLYQPFLSEDQGRTISILPITIDLSRYQNEKTPYELINLLSKIASKNKDNCVVSCDLGVAIFDGFSSSKKEKWLFTLYELLLKERWISTISPLSCIRKATEKSRIYLSCITNDYLSSGKETASVFRKNVIRHPDSSFIYSRMLYTHLLVNQVRRDKVRKLSALSDLWRGQTYYPFQSDLINGICNPKVRHEVYSAFIEAEKTARDYASFSPSLLAVDIDLDGANEWLYQGKVFNAFVHRKGGVIVELDHISSCQNYLATLTRTSTEKIYADEINDLYARKAFVDHFMTSNKPITSMDLVYTNGVGDFVDSNYKMKELDRDRLSLSLHRHGRIKKEDKIFDFEMIKRYRFKGRSLGVEYTFQGESDQEAMIYHGIEVNLSFLDPDRLKFDLVPRGAGLDKVEACYTGNDSVTLEGEGDLRFIDESTGVMINLTLENFDYVLCSPVFSGGAYQFTTCLVVYSALLSSEKSVRYLTGLSYSRLRS